ncbi:MAG: ATP-binding cassette domain-containing protein, partial [Thermoanaerobaculia bacterium]
GYLWVRGDEHFRRAAGGLALTVIEKGLVTLKTALIPSFGVLIVGMALAVYFLGHPRSRSVAIPFLILFNTPPIVLLIWVFSQYGLTGESPLQVSAILFLSNLILYFYTEGYYRELREELHKPYFETYLFANRPLLNPLFEKMLWLWSRSFRPVLFQIAGYTLFTDLLLLQDSDRSGLFGLLFSHATRGTLENELFFLFSLTAAFFAGWLLALELCLLNPLENHLLGRRPGGLPGKALAALARALGQIGDGRKRGVVYPRDHRAGGAGSRLLIGVYAALAVGLVVAAVIGFSGLGHRLFESIATAATTAEAEIRPRASTLESIWEGARRKGLSPPPLPELDAVETSGLLQGNRDRDLESDMRRLVLLLKDLRFLALQRMVLPLVLFGLLAVGLAYAMSLLVEFQRSRRWAPVAWIPDAIEALPLFYPLLLGYSMTVKTEQKLFWFGGLAIVALPVFYRQSARAIRELMNQNLIDGERMLGISDVGIIGRLTKFRMAPMLISQLFFFVGMTVALDTSMNYLRPFKLDQHTLSSLLGRVRVVAEEIAAMPGHHPLTLPIFDQLQWQLLLILAALTVACFLAQQALSSLGWQRLASGRRTERGTDLSLHSASVAPATERPSDALLTVEGLTVRFRGAEDPTLSRVSFSIRSGESVAVVGLSGSGKSVLLKAVTGMLEGADVTFDYLALDFGTESDSWTAPHPRDYRKFQRKVRPILAA